jgi:hypothetical protein
MEASQLQRGLHMTSQIPAELEIFTITHDSLPLRELIVLKETAWRRDVRVDYAHSASFLLKLEQKEVALQPLFPLEFIIGCLSSASSFLNAASYVSIGDDEEAWLLLSDGETFRLLWCSQVYFEKWRADPSSYFFGRAVNFAEQEWLETTPRGHLLQLTSRDWIRATVELGSDYMAYLKLLDPETFGPRLSKDVLRLEECLSQAKGLPPP